MEFYRQISMINTRTTPMTTRSIPRVHTMPTSAVIMVTAGTMADITAGIMAAGDSTAAADLMVADIIDRVLRPRSSTIT